ncbi:MAG TPA: DUF4136 domain-containing protein [Candidatus Krumholzibacteria bacterium]
MIHRNTLVAGGAFLLLALALFVSCYPGDELTVSETDTVVTLFDKTVDFGALTTYAMPDTIIHLVGEGDEDNVGRNYDDEILASIASNMEALGFTRVNDAPGSPEIDTADVHVLVGATVQDYVGYAYYGWYWDYWYGYYPPYWGWYPWYPSGGVAYSYSVGTILITMTEPHRTDSSGQRVPPVWSAGLNGLADKGTNAQRIERGIDQAFAQSKYLGAGK